MKIERRERIRVWRRKKEGKKTKKNMWMKKKIKNKKLKLKNTITIFS